MKKFLMAMAVVPLMALADAWTDESTGYTWYYNVSGGTAEIRNGYSCAVSPKPSGSLTIPSQINGYSVTSIGSSAFEYCSTLTLVTIPASVAGIGSSAFSACSGLEELKIPASVTSIGDEAFDGCTGLKSMTIPAGVTSIGRYAFHNCSGLTSLTLSWGVVSIGYGAFCNCSRLKSVTMPKSVTSVGSFAFEGCSGLESITLPFIGTQRGQGGRFSAIFWNVPDSLATVTLTDEVAIPDYAFEGCKHVRTITLPIGVSAIGDSAFKGCESLNAISMPAGIAKIGSSAFYGCSSLSEVVIPVGVPSIESSTFYDCTSLRKVTLPVGLTEIGSSAFCKCRNLCQINIPSTVSSIGSGAFSGCAGLGSGVVVVDGWLLTVNGNYPADIVIDKDVHLVAGAFSGSDSLQSVTISAQMEVLPNDLFAYCSTLKKVVLPTSLRVIGERTFYGCYSLEGIQLPETLIEVREGAFSGCASIQTFNVPASVTGLWSLPTGFEDRLLRGDESISSRLSKLTVASGNKKFAAYENVLYSKDGRILIRCAPASSSVVIRSGTKYIDRYAFAGCAMLTSIVVPEGVEGIGNVQNLLPDEEWPSLGVGWFYLGSDARSSPLQSISLPSTLTYFDPLAFDDLPTLSKLTVSTENKTYLTYDNVLYDKVDKILLRCPRALQQARIWDEVESIESGAFSGCALIESLTIPASVKKIGSAPFFGCENLQSIYYKCDAPFPSYDPCCKWDTWDDVDEGDAAELQAEWGLYVLGNDCCTSMKEFLSVTSYAQKGTKWWGGSGEWQGRPLVFVDGMPPDGTVHYEVRFDVNGGMGTIASILVQRGHVYKLPKCTLKPPEGKTRFVGWAGANGKRYDDEMLVFDLAKPGETVKMTAIWK